MENPTIHAEQIKLPWHKSIATRLSSVTIIVVVAAMATLGAGLIWIARNSQLESSALSLWKSADKVSILVSSYVRHAEEDLRLFLDTQHLASMTPPEQKTAMESLLSSRSPEFSQIALVDRNGTERIKVSRFHTFLPHEMGSQASNPVFRAALDGRIYHSSIFISPDSGMLSLQMAMPSDMESKGPVLLADVNISRLWQEVALTEIGRTGYAYLIDVRGRFVAFQEPATVLRRYGEDMRRMPPVSAFMKGAPVTKQRVQAYQGLTGEQVIGLFMPIKGTGWSVIVEMPTKEAYASVIKMQWYLLGLTLLGALIAGIIVLLMSRRLIQPLNTLATAAQRMGAKDWDIDVGDVGRNDEVSILGQVFSQMRLELRDLYENIERQVQELRESKEDLEKSESRFRFLTEKMNDVIWTMTLDLRLTYISPSIKRILGYSVDEFMTMNMEEIMTRESLSRAMELITIELDRDGREDVDPDRMIMTEFQYHHKNGNLVWLESVISAIRNRDGAIIGIHGVSRDITERKHAEEEKMRLEAQLAQAQKIEAIGTLAGGIAHDFNNILSAIIGYTELAKNDLKNPEKADKELKEVLKASDRAKNLVTQILTFSRKSEPIYSPLDITPLIKESLQMLRSVIPTTIEIRQDLMDSVLVMSDPTRIHQVMMNLCTNAAHAMDETGGVLTVRLKKVNIDASAARKLDLSAGNYVMLTVSDTGKGMTSEVMDRIFEPYFTTKEMGRGTGLGLSVVHGIVKSHRGAVTCESDLGKGTTFRVYFPEIVLEKEMEESQKEEPLPTGGERILFIDDESALAEMAENMIGMLGYKVTATTSSIEALKLFQENPGMYDLIITDMTMPGMTGDKLAQKIMEIRSDMPIILCTGYSEHVSETMSKEIGIRELVMKPFEMKKLARTIRQVLDAR